MPPRSETCSRCGEEIRFGVREPIPTPRWLHAQEVDHTVLHGQPWTEEAKAENERQRHLPRQRPVLDKQGNETGKFVTYTTAEFDEARYSKAKRDQLAEERDDGEDEERDDGEDEEPLPEPEIQARDIDISEFAPRSGIRQIYNLVEKTPGWSIVNLRYARGPRMGASGGSLGMSDSVVLRAKQDKALDGTMRVAVASWIDGAFNIAWIGTVGTDNVISPDRVNSNEMKDWIRQ